MYTSIKLILKTAAREKKIKLPEHAVVSKYIYSLWYCSLVCTKTLLRLMSELSC